MQECYEKTEHSEVKCFLHISREAEIHTISKTQNMGIVNLLSTGKSWENTNIPKVWISYNVCHSSILREIETFFPITWQNGIHIVRETYRKTQTFQSYRISMVREKYGKTQTFQIYGFLKYLGRSRNPYNFQNMGKVNSHNTGKVWEKQAFQSYRFLKYFG